LSKNTADGSWVGLPRAAVVLFPVFYSVVFIISVCGNSLVLYVSCQRRQKFNSTSVYLVNLALSDTLFTLALPSRITYYSRHFDWPFGDLLCRLTTLLFFANTYAGIGFMTCISLDRYLAMVHPHRLQCLRNVKVVRRVCCLVWVLELRAFKLSLQITVSLMNFNCCLDPVIYFFAIKTYKKQVLSLLKDYLYTGASSKMTAENSSTRHQASNRTDEINHTYFSLQTLTMGSAKSNTM
uniref:G-protein coupled receptors family 1 profile domain-containing protein n=1 Tax=Mola mola TaxID=94237 RepID=A0A3Q3XI46_MOLML